MVTCSYISELSASQYDMFFILFTSLGVFGQSSAESMIPVGNSVDTSAQLSILNYQSICLQ